MTERALRRLPRNHRPHQLDVLGAVLMVGAALSLMLALAWGGTHYPWTSSRIVTLLASSAALWVLFALRLLTAREPFIPLAILHGRVTSDHHRRGVLQCRHHYRHHDLHAALLPDRARRFGEPVRPCADRLHGRRRARLADRRPADGAHYALHAAADRRLGDRRQARSSCFAVDPAGLFARRGRVLVVRASASGSGRCIRSAPSSCRTASSRISWARRPAR